MSRVFKWNRPGLKKVKPKKVVDVRLVKWELWTKACTIPKGIVQFCESQWTDVLLSFLNMTWITKDSEAAHAAALVSDTSNNV